MKLDKEKVSQIQTVLLTDDSNVEFTDSEFEKGLWYISNRNIDKFDEGGGGKESQIVETFSNYVGDKDYSDFFKEVEGKELKARLSMGYHLGKCQYKVYEDWEKLAKVLGISELVTVATKIPKTVAKRFEMFADEKSDRSSVLRELVYDYVKKKMIEQAGSLMFREEI